MSLITVFSIDFSCNEFNIIVEAEDAGDEQEGLGDIDQQAVRHVVDHDDLISHQCNAAHDEQHRTGILRDFKVCVFHSTEFFAADDSRLLRTSFSAAESLVRVCPRKSAADFTSSPIRHRHPTGR